MHSTSFRVTVITLLLLSMASAKVDYPSSPSLYDHDTFLDNFDGTKFQYTYQGDDGLLHYGEVNAQFDYIGATYDITASILNFSISDYDFAGQTNIYDDPYSGDVFVVFSESSFESYTAYSHIMRFKDNQMVKEFIVGGDFNFSSSWFPVDDKLYFGVQDGNSYNIYYYDTSADTIHKVFDLKDTIFGNDTSYYSFSLNNQLVNDTLYLVGTYVQPSTWDEEHSLFAITLDGLSTNSILIDTLSGGWIQDLSEYENEVYLIRKVAGDTNITIYSDGSVESINSDLEYSYLHMTNNTDLFARDHSSVCELTLYNGSLEENWCASIPPNVELSHQILARDGKVAFATISDTEAKFYLMSATSIPTLFDLIPTSVISSTNPSSDTSETSTQSPEVEIITETVTITPTIAMNYGYMGVISLMIIAVFSRIFVKKR